MALTEDECWAIDHQIRCDLTVNGKPVGRAILLKVFRALTEFANERDSESGVAQLGTLADLLRPPGRRGAKAATRTRRPGDPRPGGPQTPARGRTGRGPTGRTGTRRTTPRQAPSPAASSAVRGRLRAAPDQAGAARAGGCPAVVAL